jgi:peptidoglycan/LPS O-acetylase OafA/YrhL
VPVLALVLASFTLSMAAPDDTKYMERYLFLMGFFFLGHYLSTSKTVLSSLTTTKVMVLALPLAVGFSVHSMMSGGINYKVEYILPTLAGIAVLIALSRLLAGTSWSQPMDFIGRHSVVFFVIHYPVTYGITALCFAAGLTSIPFVTAVALVVALCTCLVAALLRDRIWLTEYLYSVPMRNMRSHNR